jgi:hypothetical protein
MNRPAEMVAAIDADTLAVVAPHMYGCPASIAEIEALCRSKGVFLVDDAAVRRARLLLAAAAGQVVRNGLAVLGISAPEEM